MDTSGQQQPTLVEDSTVPAFLLWCLRALGLDPRDDGQGVYTITLAGNSDQPQEADSLPDDFVGREVLGRKFLIDTPAEPLDNTTTEIELLQFDSPLGQWIRTQIAPRRRVLHAAPADQPASIHPLAAALFAPYHVDGGHVHLTGCRLEDRPFLRLSYVADKPDSSPHLVECFAANDGGLLDDETMQQLELSILDCPHGKPPHLDDAVLQQWIEVADRKCVARPAEAPATLIAATVVWCKYASGKLSFTIDGNTAELEFSGWARLIRDGKIVPPPFTCPWTGKHSYHITATDDGRITVAEAIVRCAQSGRRVLPSDLETCDVSKREVLPEYLRMCPITHARVLPEYLATCTMCGQQVSQAAIVRGLCTACRTLRSVSPEDPVLARILGTYPRLDRLGRWRIAETDTVYILVGSQLWKRFLFVLDKESLEPRRAASSGRWGRHWSLLTDVQRTDWLGG